MHPSPISVRPREAEARRRWGAVAFSCSALLVAPLAVWLAFPSPTAAPAPRVPPPPTQEEEAPAPVVTEARPAPAPLPALAAPPPPADAGEAPEKAATGIAGIVVDDQGMPVMNYWIGVAAFHAAGGAADGGSPVAKRSIDDPEGAFALTDLAPGHYELAVSVPFGPLTRSQGVEVRAGSMTTGVRIAVRPSVTITGTVTDAATHAPIDGAKAFVLWGGLSTRQPLTRGGGLFTLNDAPAGTFDLRVVALGYPVKIVPGLEGRPGGPPLHVDVALDREPPPAP